MQLPNVQSRPLKGAVIGFGFISAKGHLPAYLSHPNDFEIIAVADICEARRALAQQALPNARIYADYESLLAAEAKNLDFVDISTPPCDHAEITHASFDHGLHVLCEKPIGTSAEEARAMLDHAKRVGRVFFPSHNYKHAPVIRAVREVLDAGAIGNVHLVTLDTFRNTHAKGVAEWKPDWRREHKYSGGGIAMDHGSHTFYLAFEWLASYPTSITAKTSFIGGYDTEDSLTCTVNFPTGVAVAQLTWTAGFRRVIYTLHGSLGAIKVEDDDIEVTIRGEGNIPASVEKRTISSDWMDASHATWFASVQQQFATAIEEGDFVGKEANEAFLCVQLIDRAYASSAAQCRELPLTMAASSDVVPALPDNMVKPIAVETKKKSVSMRD